MDTDIIPPLTISTIYHNYQGTTTVPKDFHRMILKEFLGQCEAFLKAFATCSHYFPSPLYGSQGTRFQFTVGQRSSVIISRPCSRCAPRWSSSHRYSPVQQLQPQLLAQCILSLNYKINKSRAFSRYGSVPVLDRSSTASRSGCGSGQAHHLFVSPVWPLLQ